MKIAVLGGGVAGISSAILLKLQGCDVTVYERHAGASTIGAGLVVWPNAAFVLERLGMLDQIKAVAGYPGIFHIGWLRIRAICNARLRNSPPSGLKRRPASPWRDGAWLCHCSIAMRNFARIETKAVSTPILRGRLRRWPMDGAGT